ncbi:response regulator [Synechocystis sp. LKSZ1]|uniref:response regulator n=1 Tax=Synechocystis sp. LKSZ1 TaxID=3144951 RepID=UPI00336BFE23
MMPPPLSSSANLTQTEGTLYRVLQKLIINQASGKLIVENPSDSSLHWRIYLGNGRIHFAGSEKGQSERLGYLLQRYVPNKTFQLPETITDDYQYLCDLWQSGEFSFQEVRSILAKFTQEALIQILSLKQPRCHFENTVGLEHLLLYLDLKQLMVPAEQQIKYWAKLRAEIPSVLYRPTVTEPELLDQFVSRHLLLDSKQGTQFQLVRSLLEEKLCLYELAQRGQTSTLNTALVLQPLIKTDVIKLLPYELPQADNRPVVACVDDSPSIQRVVSFTLEASGFRVINIKDPVKALTALLHAKPDLILMDINMPEIDGYQLCSLCNKSSALKDIPVVMLTGRNGILDRVKAKMAGSVGYICKPFLPQELVQTVSTYISQSSPSKEA